MSGGVIAAIVIGVLLVIIFIGIMCYMCYKRNIEEEKNTGIQLNVQVQTPYLLEGHPQG